MVDSWLDKYVINIYNAIYITIEFLVIIEIILLNLQQK